MLVSIITVCRNDLSGLKRTYESVIRQQQSLFEWVVIDGASTDGTTDFLSSLPAGFGNWVSEPDGGIYAAMNKGIVRSVGQYCLFLNAGDELAGPDTLLQVSQSVVSQDIVYGDAIEITDNAEAYKKAFGHQRAGYSMFTHHQAIFYRREMLSAGYDTSFKLAADWAMTSLLLSAGASALYVQYPICRFHRGGASDRPDMRRLANEELWRVYREVHRHNAIVSVLLYLVKRGANGIRFHCKPLYSFIRMRRTGSGTFR